MGKLLAGDDSVLTRDSNAFLLVPFQVPLPTFSVCVADIAASKGATVPAVSSITASLLSLAISPGLKDVILASTPECVACGSKSCNSEKSGDLERHHLVK